MTYRAHIIYKLKRKKLPVAMRLMPQAEMLTGILRDHGPVVRPRFLELIRKASEGRYSQSPEIILNWWQKKLITAGVMEKSK